MKIFILITGMMSFVLQHCNTHNPESFDETNSVPKDKLVLYTEDSSAKGTRKTLFLRNLANILQLPLINKGKEGLYVRIWIWEFERKYVINLSKDQFGNECSIVEFNSKTIDSAEYIIIHKVYKNLQPSSGWDQFFSMLNTYQIPVLKNGKSFKELAGDLTQMDYYQFEIAQSNAYRFYEYLNPAYYRYVDVGSRNIHEFLEYLNKQMNIHIYIPPTHLFKEP